MEDDRLHASVAGIVDKVNKLICVKPLKTRWLFCYPTRDTNWAWSPEIDVVLKNGWQLSVTGILFRYNGEVGDVLIGRILEVGQRRWKVDTNTKLDSMLMLSAVNLPGGELVNILLHV